MDNDIKNGILTNNKYMIEQGINTIFSTHRFVMDKVKEYCDYVTGMLTAAFIFSDYSVGNVKKDIIIIKDHKGNRPFVIKIKLNVIHEAKDELFSYVFVFNENVCTVR